MLKLATLVYVKRPGQTLMLHRIKRQQDMHQGKWNGLGGKLEPGETPEACAVREVYEESGLAIRAPELRGFLTFPAFRPDEDWYCFVFVARHFTGELIDSAEGVLAWIDDDRLLELPLWPGDRIFLPWLDQPRFFSGKFVYTNGALTQHDVVFYPPAPTDQLLQSAHAAPPAAAQDLARRDDTYCWLCGAAVVKRQCKIICTVCGFRRDCSDP
jgi:8-oxo-dGTP diphosphatase